MRLFIDIDNTVGDLIRHYIIWYNNLFIYPDPKDEPLDTNIWDKLYTSDFVEYISKIRKTAYEDEKQRHIQIFNSYDFWRTELILPNVKDILYQLDKKYEVYLLTSPSFRSTNFFNGRVEWVRRNFPYFDYNKIIFCKNKFLLGETGNSILIDDYPQNIEAWQGLTIKISYPYNFQFRANKIFEPYEWEKVPSLIEDLLEKKEDDL